MLGSIGNQVRLFLALLLMSAVVLSGCASLQDAGPSGGTNKKTAPSESSAATAGSSRDVAVISLDLDPPVRVLQVGQSSRQFVLLAAIDNKGSVTERQIVVRAQLRSLPNNEVLIERSEVIPTLAPGQATIVKFVDLPGIPPRNGYELTVAVEPVPGEATTANNSQTLPFQLVFSQ